MDEWTPEPQEQGWLEPPRRRPPTAIGVATPPPPRGPRRSRFREPRMRRIGRALAKLFFTTMLGFAVGAIVPMPILLSSLVGLTGARFIDRRRRLQALRRAVLSRSGEWRRAA